MMRRARRILWISFFTVFRNYSTARSREFQGDREHTVSQTHFGIRASYISCATVCTADANGSVQKGGRSDIGLEAECRAHGKIAILVA